MPESSLEESLARARARLAVHGPKRRADGGRARLQGAVEDELCKLGVVECLKALDTVYGAHVEEGLLLRALTYFVDAEVEAPLPGEGAADWDTVKGFFVARVGALLIPPEEPLAIQARSVDVRRARSRKAK